MFKADLHVHTTFSDGSMSPHEILELAGEKNIDAISFTDHENIYAFDEGKEKAKELGIFLIPGVELSTMVDDLNIHVLGYSFDSKKMQPIIEEYLAIKIKRNEQILEKLDSYGMHLTLDDLTLFSKEMTTLGRVHIAQAMQRKGFVKSVDEAFQHWLGDNQPCFIKVERFGVKQTIDHIHAAGGLAVLAHPHFIRSKKALDTLYEMPFDGIEANYALFSEAQNIKWMEWAGRKGWFCTGGSDFHGDVKKNIILGCNYSGRGIFDILYTHYESNGVE